MKNRIIQWSGFLFLCIFSVSLVNMPIISLAADGKEKTAQENENVFEVTK